MIRTTPAVALLLLLVVAIVAKAAGAGLPLQEVARISLPDVRGRIDHLAAELDRDRLYVAALGNDTVEVIDVAKQERVGSLRGFREPQGVFVVPGIGRLAVTNGQAQRLTIVDTSRLEPVAEVRVPEDGDNVRFETATGDLWIGAGSDGRGALLAIDPAGGRKHKEIALNGHPESFRLEQQSPRIYVNVPADGSIQVIDRTSGRLIDRWKVPAAANFPMALDEASQRLLVVTRQPARLLIYDTRSGRLVANLPTVGDADDLFNDPETGRIYVCGGEGSIQVLQRETAERYAPVQSIATRAGARTGLYVPEWHRLFVALPARNGSPAEVRVFRNAR